MKRNQVAIILVSRLANTFRPTNFWVIRERPNRFASDNSLLRKTTPCNINGRSVWML